MLCVDAKQSLLLSHESVVMSSSCYHSPYTPVQLTHATLNHLDPWHTGEPTVEIELARLVSRSLFSTPVFSGTLVISSIHHTDIHNSK